MIHHPSAALAAKLSAMGRHGDSTLIHVNEDELRGIASLGKLTVNPKTGLLEAFSLAQPSATSGGMQRPLDPMAQAAAAGWGWSAGNPEMADMGGWTNSKTGAYAGSNLRPGSGMPTDAGLTYVGQAKEGTLGLDGTLYQDAQGKFWTQDRGANGDQLRATDLTSTQVGNIVSGYNTAQQQHDTHEANSVLGKIDAFGEKYAPAIILGAFGGGALGAFGGAGGAAGAGTATYGAGLPALTSGMTEAGWGMGVGGLGGDAAGMAAAAGAGGAGVTSSISNYVAPDIASQVGAWTSDAAAGVAPEVGALYSGLDATQLAAAGLGPGATSASLGTTLGMGADAFTGAGGAAGSAAPAWYTPEVAAGTAPEMYAGVGADAVGATPSWYNAAEAAAGTGPYTLGTGTSGGFLDTLSSGIDSLSSSSIGKFITDHPQISGALASAGLGLAGTVAGGKQADLMKERQDAADAALQGKLAAIPAMPQSQPPMDAQTMYDRYSARFAPKGYADGGEVEPRVKNQTILQKLESWRRQRRNAEIEALSDAKGEWRDPEARSEGGWGYLDMGAFEPGVREARINAILNRYEAMREGTRYAGGGIVSLAGGGLAPMPGMAEETQRRRSATAFIRNTYEDIIHARADLLNPESPLLRLGIKGPNDPLLIAAFSGGGREVQGPGDGTQDAIPATIDGKQAAALSSGEYVIPARHVSALGNGSTTAGSAKLHAMLDRINKSAGLPKKQQDVGDRVMPA